MTSCWPLSRLLACGLSCFIGARDVMNVPLRTTSLMSPRLHETSCEIVWPGDCATA